MACVKRARYHSILIYASLLKKGNGTEKLTEPI